LLEKALRYLRLAGQRAVARSALADARIWFERALGLLDTLPATPAMREQAFEIRLDLRPVLIYLGEGRQMLERLREAEALAEQLDDDRRRGSVCGFMAATHTLLGESDRALAAGCRARELASRLGDLRLRIHATSHLLQAHHLRGDHERVVELAADNLAVMPPELLHDRLGSAATPSVLDRSWLLISLAELGRFAEAAEHAADAIRLAEPTQHAYTIGLAHCSAGTLHLLSHDWVKARDRLEHGIAALRTGNIVLGLSATIASSAWVLAELGEMDEALKRLHEGEQLREPLGARGFIAFLGWIHLSLGRAWLALGRIDDAERHGERGVECSPCNPGWAAHARHLLADIAARPDRLDIERAETQYRRALALAESRGMRPLVAHCHLGLGQLYARIGDRGQAAEHADSAATMYREMGLTHAGRPAPSTVRCRVTGSRDPSARLRGGGRTGTPSCAP
jgi:tetratricopeptide (TPR) repeat protein